MQCSGISVQRILLLQSMVSRAHGFSSYGSQAVELWCMGFPQLVKNQPAMQETRAWFLGWEGPLEKEMATHCSVLAWRIPWTEKPVRLQSLGSQESDTTYRLKREMGFVDLRYVGSSRIRDKNQASFTGRQILYQWATREVPVWVIATASHGSFNF